MGQPFNVVNRTGGSGVVGHSAIATAAPDGYNIGMLTVEIAMMHHQGLTELTPSSYTPLGLMNEDPPGVQVSTSGPYKDIKALAEAIKAAPAGKLKASGTGQGGIWHLALVGWLTAMGLKPDHVAWVPSNGAAPAMQDLAAGGLDLVTCSVPEARAIIEAGKARSLAVMAAERPAALGTGTLPSWRKLRRLTSRELRVWRAASGYITLTRVHQQELEDRFGMRANAAVVPDGVRLPDLRTFTDPPSAQPVTLTYAGHLYKWKGVDVLIDALAELPGVRARIVGGQPGETDHVRLHALAGARGVTDRVTFTGWLQPAFVAAELASAHVLVLPNTHTLTSDRYTSPLKLFEYLAAGRPIVASDLHAVREVLRDDDNALLVAPGSSAALAAAVRRLISDPALGRRLAAKAFDDAGYYGWGTRAERIDVVLNAARAEA